MNIVQQRRAAIFRRPILSTPIRGKTVDEARATLASRYPPEQYTLRPTTQVTLKSSARPGERESAWRFWIARTKPKPKVEPGPPKPAPPEPVPPVPPEPPVPTPATASDKEKNRGHGWRKAG